MGLLWEQQEKEDSHMLGVEFSQTCNERYFSFLPLYTNTAQCCLLYYVLTFTTFIHIQVTDFDVPSQNCHHSMFLCAEHKKDQCNRTQHGYITLSNNLVTLCLH